MSNDRNETPKYTLEQFIAQGINGSIRNPEKIDAYLHVFLKPLRDRLINDQGELYSVNAIVRRLGVLRLNAVWEIRLSLRAWEIIYDDLDLSVDVEKEVKNGLEEIGFYQSVLEAINERFKDKYEAHEKSGTVRSSLSY